MSIAVVTETKPTLCSHHNVAHSTNSTAVLLKTIRTECKCQQHRNFHKTIFLNFSINLRPKFALPNLLKFQQTYTLEPKFQCTGIKTNLLVTNSDKI